MGVLGFTAVLTCMTVPVPEKNTGIQRTGKTGESLISEPNAIMVATPSWVAGVCPSLYCSHRQEVLY